MIAFVFAVENDDDKFRWIDVRRMCRIMLPVCI